VPRLYIWVMSHSMTHTTHVLHDCFWRLRCLVYIYESCHTRWHTLHMCCMTASDVWGASFIYINKFIYMSHVTLDDTHYTCVAWLLLTSEVPHLYIWQNAPTGWQKCIGCLELQVSFRNRTTNCRALLRKITCKDKASDASSPPCTRLVRVLTYV